MNRMPHNSMKRRPIDSRRVDGIVYGLYALCALLFLADLIHSRHTHYNVEGWPGFYSVFGFVSCVALVLVARGLRRVLKREEDFYDS